MQPDSILADYRLFYSDSESMAHRFKNLNRSISYSASSDSIVTECNYLRGCFYFDFEAYNDARKHLKIALSGSEFMEVWIILKIRELIIVCDLYLGGDSNDLNDYMLAYDQADDEDRVLPIELRDAVSCIKDVGFRSLLDKWLHDKLR